MESAPRPATSFPAQVAPRAEVGKLLMSTTHQLEGYRIVRYFGIVDADAILGANMVRDFFAGIRDAVGGRVAGYEKVLANCKRDAVVAMMEKAAKGGANAVIGIDLDFQTIQVQDGGSMMMVSATGTAVFIEPVK